MTNTLANLARMTTSTTGTGTITLGSAVEGFLAFADELSSGDVITYAIEDGNQREIGQGTFTISGATHTLTRSTVYASTQGGAQISLSGSAQVFVTPAKQDLDNVMTDDERTKLAGIEAGATADQTGSEMVSAIDSQLGNTDWRSGGSGNTPAVYGAAGNGTTDDTAAFTALEAVYTNHEIDLCGDTYLVTAIPRANRYVNGWWRIANYDEAATIDIPAYETLDSFETRIYARKKSLGWPQDSVYSYNGRTDVGYMPATGHEPGEEGWTQATFVDRGRTLVRFETAEFGSNVNDETEVFGACVVPPSTAGGSYDGAYALAAVRDGDGASPDYLRLYYRALAEYEQDGQSATPLDQAEGAWTEATVDSTTWGEALRSAVDTAYTVTTSGLPTLIHTMCPYGISDAATSDFLFGFHGLSGASGGPYIGYLTGSPKDGAGAISAVGRIGLLTNGVEPSVAWYLNGASTRLCGFIRTEGAYPIRFWNTQSNGISQAIIEGADVQGHPGGNDHGKQSPIPCRMRPKRKGTVSGWIATDETLDGDGSDQLWFCYTAQRIRDGDPGYVDLYLGSCAVDDFDDLWASAKIRLIDQLYFANSNISQGGNQVGIPSMTWIDSNTLMVVVATEHQAVDGDFDESYIKTIVFRIDDDYADAAERRTFDDGTTRPFAAIPHNRDNPTFDGVTVEGMLNLGTKASVTIASGVITLTNTWTRVDTESAAASDDLDTITAGRDGDLAILTASSSSRSVVCKDGTGNLSLEGDFTMNNARDTIMLIYDATAAQWLELSRRDNGA